MAKKLGLYPMSRDMCAIARYSDLLEGYTLSKLMTPSFMLLNGEDVSILDGGYLANMTLSDFTKEGIAECDTLFVEYCDSLKDLGLYKEAIESAELMGKEVIISRALAEKLEINISYTKGSCSPKHTSRNKLFDINVPVVMVFTQGAYADQFAVELALRKHFRGEGYKVGQIGSRECSNFFGFPSVPDVLYDCQDVYGNILQFNSFVKDLVDVEKPELLILGAPNAMMKYNNRILQGLGLLPYIVSSAVSSDVSVACMYYGSYKNSFYEDVSQFGKYHLGNPICFFSMANAAISSSSTPDISELEIICLDSEFVKKGISETVISDEYRLFNSLDSESIKRACIEVHDVLAGNVRYMR